MATIGASVGRGGVNRPQDVMAVQTLLNQNIGLITPFRPLRVDGVAGSATISAIEEFQRRVLYMPRSDGRVDPHGQTLAKLNAGAGGAGPSQSAITITGEPLPDKPKQVLTEILKAAGLTSARVTSVSRSPHEQARVMYDNIIGHGASYNYTLYGPAGDEVIKVYDENKSKSKDEIIRLMEAKIKHLGPPKVSRHCSESHYVFDVAPSSITNHKKFSDATKAHKSVSKLIEPPVDPAFHIEIPK